MAKRSGSSQSTATAPKARAGQHPQPRRRDYAAAPATRWSLAIWLWLPLSVAAGLIATAHASSHDGPGTLIGHLGILLTVAVACTVAHARRSVQLDDNRLIVRSTFFTKRVPLHALRLDSARIVDLAEHTAFKPGLQLLGFGYPGFKSGHYRSKSAARGFYLLTQSRRVLILPLRDNGLVVLSLEQPHQLLEDLRQLAVRHA
ncbi:PH domain-containing protein [Xanthomonas sp. BRIP62411]|uniref:PH domain-containing protein n=1 Tax=Xanthomonas sp. BRIP62411 TaxID=2182389 RepID=UPI000F8F662A|nr:PH domain-containing protein [Xanthomonas sp. BRIP62411]